MVIFFHAIEKYVVMSLQGQRTKVNRLSEFQ